MVSVESIDRLFSPMTSGSMRLAPRSASTGACAPAHSHSDSIRNLQLRGLGLSRFPYCKECPVVLSGSALVPAKRSLAVGSHTEFQSHWT